MEKPPMPSKPKSKRLSIRRSKDSRPSRRAAASAPSGEDVPESNLPPEMHEQLWKLFSQIEREFEKLHAENVMCE